MWGHVGRTLPSTSSGQALSAAFDFVLDFVFGEQSRFSRPRTKINIKSDGQSLP
jgi:hypothetical protein